MTKYIIADNNQSVFVGKDKSNKYTLTTDRAKAVIFDTKSIADMVFKSNLSKIIKNKGVSVQTVALQIVDAVTSVVQEPAVVKEEQNTSINTDSSKHIVTIISDAVGKLNSRYVTLSDELSKYDRQITDVEHYIEFNIGKLNACGGYKAYKLLQDVLIKRRTVKDELQIIQMVRDKMGFPEEIAMIANKVQELDQRHYEPREFKYLFDDKEKENGKEM